MKGQYIRLGARETQIVTLLMRGCDNAEIARRLKIARRTVKAHLERLFRRFRITGGIKRVKLATLVVTDTKMPANESHGRLIASKREQQVIQLVAQGLKNREVADAIGIEEHVVKNYLRVIYDKLGLWNRVELALWYQSRRLGPSLSMR
jgi:DNA-binding NarL/FixJ family response regulator